AAPEPVQEGAQPAPAPQSPVAAPVADGAQEQPPAVVSPENAAPVETVQPVENTPVAEPAAVTEAPVVAEPTAVAGAVAEQAAAPVAGVAQPAPAAVEEPALADVLVFAKAAPEQPVPPVAQPFEAVPAEAAPADAVPADAVPAGTAPSETAPSEAAPEDPAAAPAAGPVPVPVAAEPVPAAPEQPVPAAAQSAPVAPEDGQQAQPQPVVPEADTAVQQAPAAVSEGLTQELAPAPEQTPEDLLLVHGTQHMDAPQDVTAPVPAGPQAVVADAPVAPVAPVEETVEQTPAEPAPAAAAQAVEPVPALDEQAAPAGPVHIPAPQQEPAPAGDAPGTPAPQPVAVPAPRTAETAPDLVVPPAEAADAPEAGTGGEGPDATDVPEAPAAPGIPAVPAAVGYDEAERAAVHRVMRERRDIRNGFRTDPVPHEVLLRVLEAAHTAPSVGHSQPWDFVVIRSAETRQAMHELAQRQRDAYAKSLPKGRAKQFKELKIEAILETPVNIVVTADPTRGGRHTLGRHTQPQMAPYSSALAVENLWLAARAEGLGVGWVSFFDEREMVRELGLPEHLEVVAYLCVGYVDEFPDEPELMQAGWSKRRPLSWVVHEEEYGRRALPGEEPHDLLAETLRGIRPLDAKALGEAWERQKRMTKPSGALGMLEIISAQLCGLSRKCPPPIPEPAAVAIFAGDHGVHAQGVTAWPQEVTSQMVANFLGGGAVCNAFANQVGAEVCVVDVGVAGDLPGTPGLLPRKIRPGTSDFTTGPAMTREEALRAIEVGIETARDLVAAGNKALLTGEMGIANTTVSAALISVYTEADPAEITGRGTGINDEMHARKIDVVRRALELHQPDPKDPIGVLTAVGGLEHAALVGLILGGASLRTPVILDGVSAGAAALVARAIAPEALAACIAGHRSAEPGHVAALTKLGLRPLVDLDLRLGEGTGALLALPVVQSAARAMHEVATFDAAGVTEKG
ncbi:nicotinate-nucleotide--dimethylbenzimidazole phosphoribosyltransferase, partial [Streptomyces sp. UNOC14_S4]|uniref:nicotinate-nucleotide--dimethylbenzimidazole phosphoribosyltransferase n=1 Tax=Streptomyces sp. UNOC14_S4 TaxID=2872340 RepID=UPI001E3B9CAC